MSLDETKSEETPAASQLALPEQGVLLEGRYVVGEKLGSGGMGAVFEATHRTVKRRYAIKFLRVELAGKSRSLSRFEREAELLGGLVHDNLTAVFDFGFYRENSPYLVMEHVAGVTLRRLLDREGKLSPERALVLLDHVCQGVAFAHRHEIIHRDLKPENLMVTARSNGEELVKILDFGIARVIGPTTAPSLTPTGADLGTPHYMSPEQARGETHVDARADVYSIGVILYEAITGQKPHPGETYNQVIFHLLTEPPTPIKRLFPECPLPLRNLIERCIHTNPDRRYADGTELLSALQEARQKLGAESAHLVPALPKRPAVGFWWGVAAGSALALAVSFGIMALRESPAPAAAVAEIALPSLVNEDVNSAPELRLSHTAAAPLMPEAENEKPSAPASAFATATSPTATPRMEPVQGAKPARPAKGESAQRSSRAALPPPEPRASAAVEAAAVERAGEPKASGGFKFLTENPYD